MKACLIILAVLLLGAAHGAPKKSCLACPKEQQNLRPICAIEFRIDGISVKTFDTQCKMEQYNCEHDRHFVELFAGACEGPNINT